LGRTLFLGFFFLFFFFFSVLSFCSFLLFFFFGFILYKYSDWKEREKEKEKAALEKKREKPKILKFYLTRNNSKKSPQVTNTLNEETRITQKESLLAWGNLAPPKEGFHQSQRETCLAGTHLEES